MTRPLWQLLLLAQNPKGDIHLTCEECFALLEYDADRLAAGAKPSEINRSVHRHLRLCTDCRTQLNELIDNLEKSKA